MDTTPEYIKMCEKATKIQEQWMPEIGDYIHSKEYNKIHIIDRQHYLDFHTTKRLKRFLPRQDQLQEMLPENNIARLSKFIQTVLSQARLGHYVSHPDYHQFKSMEQLWLAFIIKENFNKIWNGEDWVVI